MGLSLISAKDTRPTNIKRLKDRTSIPDNLYKCATLALVSTDIRRTIVYTLILNSYLDAYRVPMYHQQSSFQDWIEL
jgi:hypothetical protein